jgi:glycolate oxidase iron-sulfur subunit
MTDRELRGSGFNLTAGQGQETAALSGPYAPSEADLSRCVHCGLCLQHCPTYVETGLETESPRGRLYLIRALAEGRAEPTPNALGHLDQCLQCRNCEAVCPSGVAYGRIMEGARTALLESGRAPLAWRLRSLFLREVVARPGRLRILAEGLRAYQSLGLRSLLEKLPAINDRLLLLPPVSGRPYSRTGLLAAPPGATSDVSLLLGCIMPLSFGRVHAATVRVLKRNGCRVTAPGGQACCGALHAHNGDLRTARRLARRNIKAFAGDGPIIVNSAGCGAAMKEYGELLAADARYARKAHDFSRRVVDVTEFLAGLPFDPPQGSVNETVTYQDSCHHIHAQRISLAPRQVLHSIPGLKFIEMQHADRCCGSAGIYSLTQNKMSLQLLRSKMRAIRRAGTRVIATANPGCIAQLEAGVRRFGGASRVAHVVELLDEAYLASERGAQAIRLRPDPRPSTHS